ncbi:PITC1 protein, partial [Polyodon spathula]|nr:PITC1 protein [Polyodon spathula]
MISKHSHEQSDRGEGVEVVQNEPYEDPAHGKGQCTEKRVYLNSKLPSWARAVVPKIFYVTEKAWNYYPYTITDEEGFKKTTTCTGVPQSLRCLHVKPQVGSQSEIQTPAVFRSATVWISLLNPTDLLPLLLFPLRLHLSPLRNPEQSTLHSLYSSWYKEFIIHECSFLPKFSIHIETKYEDNNGSNDKIFGSEAQDVNREVCFVDIAYDEVPERYYKESEDLRYFKSEKTSRGLLKEGWRDSQQPIMCSYKLVTVKFEVWGLQTRVEQFVHKVVRDVLLLGHRQAFAWVDEWIDMTMDEVREFERATQEATNKKIGIFPPAISISETPLTCYTHSGPSSAPSTPLATDAPEFLSVPKDRPRKKSAPETLTLPDPADRVPRLRLPSSHLPQSSPSHQPSDANPQ